MNNKKKLHIVCFLLIEPLINSVDVVYIFFRGSFLSFRQHRHIVRSPHAFQSFAPCVSSCFHPLKFHFAQHILHTHQFMCVYAHIMCLNMFSLMELGTSTSLIFTVTYEYFAIVMCFKFFFFIHRSSNIKFSLHTKLFLLKKRIFI